MSSAGLSPWRTGPTEIWLSYIACIILDGVRFSLDHQVIYLVYYHGW